MNTFTLTYVDPKKKTAGEWCALLQYDACERAAAINIHAWFTETHLHLHSSWACSQTSSVLKSFLYVTYADFGYASISA